MYIYIHVYTSFGQISLLPPDQKVISASWFVKNPFLVEYLLQHERLMSDVIIFWDLFSTPKNPTLKLTQSSQKSNQRVERISPC